MLVVLKQMLVRLMTNHPALGEAILAIHGVPHLDKMKLTVVIGRERDGKRKQRQYDVLRQSKQHDENLIANVVLLLVRGCHLTIVDQTIGLGVARDEIHLVLVYSVLILGVTQALAPISVHHPNLTLARQHQRQGGQAQKHPRVLYSAHRDPEQQHQV